MTVEEAYGVDRLLGVTEHLTTVPKPDTKSKIRAMGLSKQEWLALAIIACDQAAPEGTTVKTIEAIAKSISQILEK